MRKLRTGLLLLAAVLGTAAATGPGAAQDAPPETAPAAATLDGKTFVGEWGEQGKDKGEAQTFVFRDGSFEVPGTSRLGFTAGPYTVEPDGSTTIFSAETQSPKQGKMRWSGTALDGQLEGVMTWYKGKKGPVRYWFRGTVEP
jgi:hypothetical protein